MDQPPTGLVPEQVFREKLKKALPQVGEVIFTENRRQLVWVKKNRDGALTVRLQHAFRAASGSDFAALADFIRKPDQVSRKAVSDFVKRYGELFGTLSSRPVPRRRTVVHVTKGRHRDLFAILRKVMDEYSLMVDGLSITFGNDPLGRMQKDEGAPAFRGRTRSRSIRFGSYSALHNLIRIHPLLDCLDIPDYFVEYIVYHEVLHALCPPISRGCRKSVHTAEFRVRERRFALYEDARRFEREWVKRFL